MPGSHSFEHLPLLRRYKDPARLFGGGTQAPQTIANKQAFKAHAKILKATAQALASAWQSRQATRQTLQLPVIPEGVPILVKVDTSLDLDALRDKFDFEIVAEQEDGFVIVASRDLHLAPFIAMVDAFSVQVRGAGTVASVHQLFDDPDQTTRLQRILSERLFIEWPTIADAQIYVVDVGIACAGAREIPPQPKRGTTDSDADWARKELAWSKSRNETYDAQDEVKSQREAELQRFAAFYKATIHSMIDGERYDAAVLSDSFTVRLEISGLGLKDLVLNNAYVFEVVEPEDVALPQRAERSEGAPAGNAAPLAPADNAPAVCVIDCGIQEAHLLLTAAIDKATSHCFLPGKQPDEVNDLFPPAGHGTRVAGAVLYGEDVAKAGAPQLPFWIQNARVLDERNQMPVALFPPVAIRAAVERFHHGPRHTRIFNHSINASVYCRTRYMSAWAAEIDAISNDLDVLVVQSVGNLPVTGDHPFSGMKDHLVAGRAYPDYLDESSCRVANPAQSLQALTVGSIGYGAFESSAWKTFASEPDHPSAFTRSGFGIWNVIKPEIVERGGDAIRTNAAPPDVQIGGPLKGSCPELVRSTMFPPGPAFDRDQAGTSFATPKAARIAAMLQATLPDGPALLYRALLVQSAQWPAWAEAMLAELRKPDLRQNDPVRRAELLNKVGSLIRVLGYGIPDAERATRNTDFRSTFITSGTTSIRARECHLYQVPVPAELRGPADEFDIRIDVTMSYVAQPRRTRRNLRRYLSTWVDWKSSKLGESMGNFRRRAMKDAPAEEAAVTGNVLPWTLHENANAGLIRTVRRNAGTVQKDWAVVKSNTLPEQFCLAVVGHPGWSHDPDSTARYAMAVTFEILGQEIPIYEPLRNAVTELQSEVEAEASVDQELEAEVE